MKTTVLAAAATLVIAALGSSGCQVAADRENPSYEASRTDSGREFYRGDRPGARYPGPALTGGGS